MPTHTPAPVPVAPFPLSVLDQSPIAHGSSAANALHHTLDLARRTEQLGYHRYWIAEHHATPALASASPEVLIAACASVTSRIRLGSGGVMLPHYSPYKVAEVFSTLAGLFPGRIDLGLGRAFGTDPATALALQRDRSRRPPDDSHAQLLELLGYVGDRLPESHPFARLAATLPGRPEAPSPWLLGSSPDSARQAAELGLPYAFADFINPDGAALARHYRDTFVPSVVSSKPYVTVAVWALCAETDAEADDLAACGEMMMRLLRRGRLIAVPSVETALRFREEFPTSDDPARPPHVVVGAPDTVKRGIERVVREYGADEAMLVTITHDHDARVRSYERIASAFGKG